MIGSLIDTAIADTMAVEAVQTSLHQTIVTCRSGNAKIGKIPATSRPQETCPLTCPFMGSGCYGENRPGRPSLFDMVGKSVASGSRGTNLATVRNRKYRKPPKAVRFNVVGDYLTHGQVPDRDYIEETNVTADAMREKYGATSWSYTHAWDGYGIAPSDFSYIVRASCQSAEEVQRAHAAGWYTAVVDPGPDAPDTLINSVIDGRRVVQCPVTTGKARDCESCRACGTAKVVIAFPTHGTAKRKASEAVRKVRTAK